MNSPTQPRPKTQPRPTTQPRPKTQPRPRPPSQPQLDETDQRIIALLRGDGRRPYRLLARQLQLTESTVRTRMRRLEQSGAMRVVAVTDFEAAGYRMLVAVGVQVEGRPPADVARELARFPEIFSVNVVIGNCAIELLLVAADQQALGELISRRIAPLAGVRRLHSSLALDVAKNQPHWVPFHDQPPGLLATAATAPPHTPPPGRTALDPVNRQIVQRLARDARTSNRQIAAELGLTEGTVRARIKRMRQQNIIRITAISNIDHIDGAAVAYLWIEVERSRQTEALVERLVAMPEMGFVGLMMGRADILAITMVQNTEHLAEFVHRRISTLEGVRRTESTLGVNFIKHDYRMARIVD